MQRPPCAGWACNEVPSCSTHGGRPGAPKQWLRAAVGQPEWNSPPQQRSSVVSARQQQRLQMGDTEFSGCMCHAHACVECRP